MRNRLSARPSLLRQVFDRLFTEQAEIIPFILRSAPATKVAPNAATRFLREFLMQTVAFRRRDAPDHDASPEFCEITELAAPGDGYWIDARRTCENGGALHDDRSFVRNCLSAPLRAAANGARSVVIIDDLSVATGSPPAMRCLRTLERYIREHRSRLFLRDGAALCMNGAG